jgi:hypothetical protein
MSTLPQTSEYTPINGASQESRTYKFDLGAKKLVGTVDGIAALEQAMSAILSTERYMFYIISPDYGREFEVFVGQSDSVALAQIAVKINEALMRDDRIIGTQNYKYYFENNSLSVQFDVITIYGMIEEEITI